MIRRAASANGEREASRLARGKKRTNSAREKNRLVNAKCLLFVQYFPVYAIQSLLNIRFSADKQKSGLRGRATLACMERNGTVRGFAVDKLFEVAHVLHFRSFLRSNPFGTTVRESSYSSRSLRAVHAPEWEQKPSVRPRPK